MQNQKLLPEHTGAWLRYCWVLPVFLLLLWASPAAAQGTCSNLTVSWLNFEPCKYRVSINNNSECTPSLRLVLDAGQFASWSANTAGGWTGVLVAPNEIALSHNSGLVPFGASAPVVFSLQPGISVTAALLWDFTCGLGESCFDEEQITSCPDPANASIIGVKYRECDAKAYTNQPVVPGWPIQLLNIDGQVIAEEVTGADGVYAFYDLPYGQYIVREALLPGWTSNIPASGEAIANLDPSEQAVVNFGNCPSCSCDSLYTDVIALDGNLDTCGYNLVVQNTSGFCYTHLTVGISDGNITSWQVTEPGWSVEPIDPKNIRINPPGGYVPLGSKYPITFKATGSNNFEITVRGYYNNGGGQVVCTRPFVYTCPKPPPPPCCPTGTVQGPELVVNGAFTAGNTGFTPFMPFFTPGNFTAIGQYSVLQSNQVYPANYQWACTDHTSGGTTAKMLIVDGANPNTNIAWQEMVPVVSNTQYAFCAYVNNLVIPTRIYAFTWC